MNPPLAKPMPKDSRMSHFSNNRRYSGPAHGSATAKRPKRLRRTAQDSAAAPGRYPPAPGRRKTHIKSLLKDAGSERTLRNWIKQAQGGPGLGRRAGTDNEASDNAADLVAHFAVALGRAKSRRTALLDMVGEDRAQRIQNRNPLKALPELTAAEHEGARQFLFRLLYLMYRAQDRAPRD